jgi:Na+/H+ antiporter NhaA
MGLAVSLMIANLSFQSEQILDQVRSGLVVTAIFSAIIGSLILTYFRKFADPVSKTSN